MILAGQTQPDSLAPALERLAKRGDVRKAVLELVNQERVASGAAPIRSNRRLGLPVQSLDLPGRAHHARDEIIESFQFLPGHLDHCLLEVVQSSDPLLVRTDDDIDRRPGRRLALDCQAGASPRGF